MGDNEEIGETKQEKVVFLKRHFIAPFDVIKSCDILASSDSSIKNPIPNDFTTILNTANIQAIFTTGQKAYQLYQKYCYPKTKIKAIPLPSTSPANCRKGIEDELEIAYKEIRKFTN